MSQDVDPEPNPAFWVTDPGRAELLRLSGVPLPGQRRSVQSLQALERAGLVRHTASGDWELLPAGREHLPEPIFAGLEPGDEITLAYRDGSGLLDGVVLHVVHAGHTAVLHAPRMGSRPYEVNSWEEYVLAQVNAGGRLRLEQTGQDQFTLTDTTTGRQVAADVTALDVRSVLVQLEHITRPLP